MKRRTMTVTVRGLDPVAYADLKARARREGRSTGEVLSAILRDGQLVGLFSSALEAFEEGKRRFGAGGSLILHIGQERWPPRGPRPIRFGRSGRVAFVDNPIREVDRPPPA